MNDFEWLKSCPAICVHSTLPGFGRSAAVAAAHLGLELSQPLQTITQRHEVWQRCIERSLAWQQDQQIELKGDGLISWSDWVSPLLSGFSGLNVNVEPSCEMPDPEQSQIVVEDVIDWGHPMMRPYWYRTLNASQQPVKLVLPGPIMLARMLERDPGYGDTLRCDIDELVRGMGYEIQALPPDLRERKLASIQLVEPRLFRGSQDLQLLQLALEKLRDIVGASTHLTLDVSGPSTTDVLKHFEQLQALAVDALLVDICPDSDQWVQAFESAATQKQIILGCVDVETAQAISDSVCLKLRDLKQQGQIQLLCITTSGGLAKFDWDHASRCHRNLQELRQRLL